MTAPAKPWGELVGIAAALWFLLGPGFETLPSKRLLDAIAVGVLILSAARLALWWRAQ